MTESAYYSQDVHGPFTLHDIGDLVLEEGGTIPGCQLVSRRAIVSVTS